MSIKNDKELEITEHQINQFRWYLRELEQIKYDGIQETIVEMEKNTINKKIEELKEDIDNYKYYMEEK